MTKATCSASPNLYIPAIGVQFVDGEAEVSEEQAKALAPYAVHGVVVVAPPARKKPTTK